MNNPHKNAVEQLERVAKILRLEYENKDLFDKAINRLKTPDRVIEGDIEVEMDNGEIKTFKAFRSQHNNAVGPYKGGIRFHQNVSKQEVMALSTWMTWKCSVTGIPYGGGKGGVVVDPKTMSQTELERLSRAYAKLITPYIGAWVDVPAPDVNTTGQIMSWMVDEYEKVTKEKYGIINENPVATFTGKPLLLGGSKGRTQATGLGGFYILERLVEKLKLVPKDTRVAIQGFGNVGYWFAHHAHKAGYKIVALSDSKGGVYNEEGLNPDKVLNCKRNKGVVGECSCTNSGCDNAITKITNEELLELDVDIIVPAALENVIHIDNAKDIKAKVILELANGPVTPQADEILFDNNVIVIPDVLANAGGVTVSYFEWVQNLQGYYWTQELVLDRLKELMNKAFETMWNIKNKIDIDARTATYISAVKKVVDTMILRGSI